MARKPATKEPQPASKPQEAPAQPKRAPQRKRRAPGKTKGRAKATTAKGEDAKPAKPQGRPSKINQEIRVKVPNKRGNLVERRLKVGEAFVFVLSTGCSIETAAGAVGIAKATVYDWMAKGKEIEGLDGDALTDDQIAYLDFSDAVTRARETVVTVALRGILEAGKADWRAFAWFLERSRPEDYGRSTRIDVGGADGKGGRMTFAEFMATATADPSTVSDDDDPDLGDRGE